MTNPAPVCPECNGERYFRYDVSLDHPYFGRLFPCPACNKQTMEFLSGLNDAERLITFDSMRKIAGRVQSARMISAAEAFAKNPTGFLSIHGTFGNGKTMCLMAIVNAVISQGVEARYMTAADLAAHMRKAFSSVEKTDDDYDRLHTLARIPVLCIDEMDKLRNTEYSREIQQELINLRYRDAGVLGTVLAWNGELAALPFPAVVSRAQEFVVIENRDSDIRPLLGKKG
jgi:DNA replication protein DnaC